MNYNYIAFDLDGTLIDTRESVFKAIRYTESKLGLDRAKDLDYYIGPPLFYAYNTLRKLDEETAKKAVRIHKEYGELKEFKEGVMFAGIDELLCELKNMKVKLAVATLRQKDLALRILKEFDLLKYFDFVGGTNKYGTLSKSDILKRAMGKLDKKNDEDMVLIGDTAFDAIGAKEAHIDFIAVTYGAGFKTQHDINQYRPVFLADSVFKLKEYLLN